MATREQELAWGRKSAANWRKRHPDRYKRQYMEQNRKRLYGVDEETYQRMHATQNGRCAICGREEIVKHNKKDVDRLAVDHDHTTGKVRELLCQACNRGLGAFEDDLDRLVKATAYLQKHAAYSAE